MRPWIRAIPPFLVRAFASRYVAGDSLERALDVAAELYASKGVLSTLDLLAEDIRDGEAAARNIDVYLAMVSAVAADARFVRVADRPTVSLKLSAYTTAARHKGGDGAGSREAAIAIAEHAAQRDIALTIDMESRFWTDFTLDTLDALHEREHHHVGIVIQTRLNRSEADLRRLPARARVRLVIGIYNEPPEVAVTDKSVMKERLLRFAEQLLQKGHYVEFASHDEHYVRRFVEDVVPRVGVSLEGYEVQMLYGVPRDVLQAELEQAGIKTRLYIPFAMGWPMAIAYLRRRLDEYPQMIGMVAKNLF